MVAKYDTMLGFLVFTGIRNTEHRVFSLFLTFNSVVGLSHETLKSSGDHSEICVGQEKHLFWAGGTGLSIFSLRVIMCTLDAK